MPAYTKNDRRGDPKPDGKMVWRITRKIKMGTVNWRQEAHDRDGWRRAIGEELILLGE
jgi:hypothetical protein